jgi:cystathionine beta-lyase/cystathionine gamma-synthase
LNKLGSLVSTLETGACGYSFSSGKAAISTVLELVESGAHIIASANPDSHAYKIFESVRRRTSGLTFTYLHNFTPDTLKTAVKENTRLIWVESIVRPLFAMPNLKLIADFSKTNDLISVCDNTLASPYLLNPIQFGFDVVIYDAVGYLSGRTDIDGGCAVVAKDREFIQEKLGFLQSTIGTTLPAIEQEKLCIALGTMKIRIDQQSKNAGRIAKFLEGHERVEKVYYLGLEAHSHHAYGNEKLTNFGGAFSVTFSDDVNAPGLQKKLNLFINSEIIGGPMSAIWHPSSEIYDAVPNEIKKHLGAEDEFFQFSIGMEDTDDLIADLDQALIN